MKAFFKGHTVKIIAVAAMFLPAALNWRYFTDAWLHAPLDRMDPVFLLLALLIFVFRFRRIAGFCEAKTNWSGLIVLFSAATLLGIGLKMHINLVIFIAMLGMVGGMAGFCWGERLFVGILPLLALLALALPSSSYWVGYAAASCLDGVFVSGLLIKIIVAVPLAAIAMFKQYPSRLKNVAFVAAVAVWLFFFILSGQRGILGDKVELACDRNHFGAWLGTDVELTDQNRRFFNGSSVRKMIFFNESEEVALLVVTPGRRVRLLHPTELCLKSGNREIISSREKMLLLDNGLSLAVQEIEFVDNSFHYLLYSWYTGPDWSTSNYLNFRRRWSRGAQCRAYQLQTLIDSSQAQAVERLDRFIGAAALPSAAVGGKTPSAIIRISE